MKYKVDHNGSTWGAKSGKRITYKKDQPVDAQKGDLDHLGKHVQEVEGEKKQQASKSSSKKN